jgi:hypothetical protein
MDFDVQTILDVRASDRTKPNAVADARMEKLWLMFSQVPLALTKYHGPTLPNLTWAPSSLLLMEDKPLDSYSCFLTTSVDPAMVTENGLRVHLPGLVFRSKLPLGLEFFVDDQDGVLYHFNLTLSERYKHLARPYKHNHHGLIKEEISIDPRNIAASETLAFVFDQVYDEDHYVPVHAGGVTEMGVLAVLHDDGPSGNNNGRATKLGEVFRMTLRPNQSNEEGLLRRYVQGAPQIQQDYEENRLKYPAEGNGTLLWTKGTSLERRMWYLA